MVKEGSGGSVDTETATADLHVLTLGLRLASMIDPDDWPIERLHDSIDCTLTAVLGTHTA